MATIKRVVHAGDKPTAEAVEEVRKVQGMPIVYDEESPELTDEDYTRMTKAVRAKRGSSKIEIE